MSAAPLLRAALLEACPEVRHGFTTRAGGVTPEPMGPLNLALRPGERPERVSENWSRVVAALDPGLDSNSLALLGQVHGAEVVRVERGGGPLATVAEADGAVTTAPGVILTVRTADCVPVIFAAPGGVAVAHAGWRGTAAGVVAATVTALTGATGCSPTEVKAVVGPCVSGDAYEVGDEVVAGLKAAGLRPEEFLAPGAGLKPHVNLRRAVSSQLRAAGVTQLAQVPGCTYQDPRFHSHRRDGPASGRQAGVVVLLPV